MFKTVALIIALSLAGCADSKTINGKEYGSYGLVTQSDEKDPAIKYSIVYGNVFWAGALAGTIVAPIYFFGWSLYEPVGTK